ncbi:MAG: DUF167 domain-containing protein [Candidatus Hydrogenedentota bacterium]|jgi:uncharacterized protein (TIGR00251 family)
MSPKPSIKAKDNGVILHLRVQPKASRNQLIHESSGKLRLAITAPPADGKANKAAIVYIAKTFGVPRRCVRILSGEKSREKSVFIDDIDVETVCSILDVADQ